MYVHEEMFPKTQMEVTVDHSSNHEAFAGDAMLVQRLSAGYGGKQPVMRGANADGTTTYTDHANRHGKGSDKQYTQSLVLTGSRPKVHGVKFGGRGHQEPRAGMAKGAVLMAVERGILPKDPKDRKAQRKKPSKQSNGHKELYNFLESEGYHDPKLPHNDTCGDVVHHRHEKSNQASSGPDLQLFLRRNK